MQQERKNTEQIIATFVELLTYSNLFSYQNKDWKFGLKTLNSVKIKK